MNATIAEFLLRQASDAAELARRAKVLAALTQLSPQRRDELAAAVNMVCRTIASHGGRGKVQFSLVQRGEHRCIEVSVSDQRVGSERPRRESEQQSGGQAGRSPAEPAVIQRVGQLVDYFESSGWPLTGAVIRMAQVLSPAFHPPTDAEVADWSRMLHARTPLEALEFALRRARSLELALGTARCQEELRSRLRGRASDGEVLTMLSLVISKTKNAISVLEPDGTLVAVNDAFVHMTGYQPSEVVGHRHEELLFGPSTESQSVTQYRQSLEQGCELTHDVLRYRKDGRMYWVESNLIPVRDAAGELTRWIVIDTDITKRRQTEDALREAKEIAETNNRLKSEFLANLSHEIRTPMNAIIGMTELALNTHLTDEQRRYLETVRSSGQSLLALLNDILDLSKIEAGRMELEQIDFSVAAVVDDVLKTLQLKGAEKGLQMRRQLPGDLPEWVRGDPTKLGQILLNLVGNAIKFTQQGEVVVEVVEQWRDANEIGLHFAVRDTGMGIPAEKLDHIFHAFTQVDASTTRKFGGSGLGLAITSELVRLMRGRIWVQSVPGQGSTFHCAIPFPLAGPPSSLPSPASTSAASPPPADAEEASWARHEATVPDRLLHILVADDHHANRDLVVTVLTKRGHRCAEAENGREVLDMLARTDQPFDVILMDVQMPIMDGYQATNVIRQQEKTTGGHLPIIALTAHALAEDRAKCLAAGMDAYLSKPLRPKDLVAVVERVSQSVEASEVASLDKADAAAEPVEFDFQVALDSLDNDLDLLTSQMRFFLHDGQALMRQVEQAIEREEAQQLRLAAHRLKGMLARYAYHRAVDIARELERCGEIGTFEAARGVSGDLARMVSRLSEAIERFLRRPETR